MDCPWLNQLLSKELVRHVHQVKASSLPLPCLKIMCLDKIPMKIKHLYEIYESSWLNMVEHR